MLHSLDGTATCYIPIMLRSISKTNQGHTYNRTDFSIFKLVYGISNIYRTKKSGENARFFDNDTENCTNFETKTLVYFDHSGIHRNKNEKYKLKQYLLFNAV